jgi:peptidoglycan/LPS O-acetylase OafA/YrhL
MPRRIATLDGLRGVAIAVVLSGVATDLGVRMFFVLSGFLITALLVRELDDRGSISLWHFYVRRALRIFPAFYAYVIAIGVAALTGAITLRRDDLLASASYTAGFHGDVSSWTGHLWSLAIVEQFYVLWPLVIAILGLYRAWWLALLAVVAAPLVRIGVGHFMPEHRALVDHALPWVGDALALGCLVAFAAPQLARSTRCARAIDSRLFWPGVVLTLASGSEALTNVAIAAVIVKCLARPDGIAAHLCRHPVLVWLGTISFSLYLWLPLAAINIVAAFAAAIACHFVIERPFLVLRERPSPPPRPPTTWVALGRSHAVLDVSANT